MNLERLENLIMAQTILNAILLGVLLAEKVT